MWHWSDESWIFKISEMNSFFKTIYIYLKKTFILNCNNISLYYYFLL